MVAELPDIFQRRERRVLHRQSELKALSLRQTLTHAARDVNSSKNIDTTAHTSRPNARFGDQFTHEIAHLALPKKRVAIAEPIYSNVLLDLRRQFARQLVFNRSVLRFGLVLIEIECQILARDSNVIPTRSLGVDNKIA